MQDLFTQILIGQKAGAIALDQVGRIPAISLAVVTDNNDPDKKRRLKVSSPYLPGLDTDWIRRLEPYPSLDPPLPTIGQTVMILAVEGNLLNSFYLSVVNETNPPIQGKTDILNDQYQEIRGSQTTDIGKNLNFIVGDSIKLSTSSGSFIELTSSGAIVLADASGVRITLTGTGDATIGGIDVKSILGIGSIDTGGFINFSQGWA